uniref:Leucine-rich repeat domain-containing protein n=1 Tax=viral metagenome TaxID=1070528 RepID=A0A6C0I0T4_9ZZZZ
MNIIEQKRRDILNDSSTATSQRELLDILENLLPTVDSIIFKEPLHGDLDFAVMQECGFNNVTSLVFEAGDITSIRNLPKQITRIHIPNNLLAHLEDLPESLVDLNAAGNGLQRIDLSALQNLKSVNISNNELTELILSPSIETLLCENNKLVELDLDGMDTLKTLNCNGNPLLSITNFQDTISNFTMESNPALEIRKKMDQTEKKEVKSNIEFKQALNQYFEIKNEYEETKKEKKTILYQRYKKRGISKIERRQLLNDYKMPCVFCQRPVNTNFSIKGHIYKAVCGDEKSPCNLHIEIYSGEYKEIKEMLNFFRNLMEKEKEDIIKIKMDSLLNYKSEKKSVKVFKKNLEEYNEISDFFKIIEKDYEDLFFNKETDTKIKTKISNIFKLQEQMREMIDNYKRTSIEIGAGSQQMLSDIMLFYVEKLFPLYKNLHESKYPFKEIELSGNVDNPVFTLIQKSLEFNKLDYSYGNREPEVISFTV